MLIPKAHAKWLRKAARFPTFFVHGSCLKIHHRSWLAVYDGFRLHALAVDDLPAGGYWIDAEGQVIANKEKSIDWSILVSHRYRDPFPFSRGILPKYARLEDRTMLEHSYVRTLHLKDAFTFAKHGLVYVPVDPMPGIRILFGDGIGDKAFALLARIGGSPQSVQYT
jgi:hypothetical protein